MIRIAKVFPVAFGSLGSHGVCFQQQWCNGLNVSMILHTPLSPKHTRSLLQCRWILSQLIELYSQYESSNPPHTSPPNYSALKRIRQGERIVGTRHVPRAMGHRLAKLNCWWKMEQRSSCKIWASVGLTFVRFGLCGLRSGRN